MSCILGIDQSTQGTKLLLFDEQGDIMCRVDKSHRQLVNEQGWVSHDLDEIYGNVILGLEELLERTGLSGREICAVGISNQRETTAAWTTDGTAVCPAVVWQCGRAAGIAKGHKSQAEQIYEKTGLKLSPYFPAAKMEWLLGHECGGLDKSRLRLGTIDTYLIYRLTGGRSFFTDATNASRTQLFNIRTMEWDEELCGIFGIPGICLARVLDSNGDFGRTDFEGVLPEPVPILAAIGDSHGALYGQGCHRKGMLKVTYGTGSSIMMNTGEELCMSGNLSTSVAYRLDGRTNYCLEGNINYTGAVMSWLKDGLGLISSTDEIEALIERANPLDGTVVIPAFTGLSAPYWKPEVRAAFLNMSRTTGRAEIVRAAAESIAQQVEDVMEEIRAALGAPVAELRADGGASGNQYLMQLQSDLGSLPVCVPDAGELSAMGAAYLAGIRAGIYREDMLFTDRKAKVYRPRLSESERRASRARWKESVALLAGEALSIQ